MTPDVTAEDAVLREIADQVRRLVGDAVASALDYHVAAGRCLRTAAEGSAVGLIAAACTFATIDHAPGCERQRAYLHRCLDTLFDDLAAFDSGRINAAGETVQ